jgi:CheY-like chemotaxis protein
VEYERTPGEKKVLIVASAEESGYFFGELLERTGLSASRIDTGKQCLEAAAQETYSLLLARIPLPDLSVSALATGLTQRFSLNADTPLLMLAEGKQYEAALGYRNPRIQIVDINDPSTNVERLVTSALGVASRTRARLDVELDVETGEAFTRRRYRTHDISRSGMLLESDATLPIGSEFVFNFTLPERFTPIHGRAQVVRHAGVRDSVSSGMGVKFIAFPEGAAEAIEAFVGQNRLYAR